MSCRQGERTRRWATTKAQDQWESGTCPQMFPDQSYSIPEICTTLGISRATLYRDVKEAEPLTS
jgi:transcriptional regulator of acetoin/glycerol metabolism